MKYMLLIYSPESGWSQDEWTNCVVKSSGICHELAAKRQFCGAAPLHPLATAKTVRVRDAKPLVTAGPFAETVEQLGGYYVIDVPNLDDAIAIAARLPPVSKGAVEIRPLMEIDGLPPSNATAPGLKKFMLLCYDDEAYWQAAGSDVHLAAIAEAVGITRELAAQGRFLSASPLRPTTTATTVRVRNGQRLVTDGPFAEMREVVGGYYLILAADAEQALAVASRHSGARVGAVEVREVVELPPIPLPTDRDIMNSRDFPFTREQIYGAFADPAKLARWWGPNGFSNTFKEFEFRSGGVWKFVMHGPDGGNYENHCTFAEIAPDRIVVEHLSAPHFRLAISLGELPGQQTRIVWMQSFDSAEVRDQVAKFAVDCNEQNFDRLTALLSS